MFAIFLNFQKRKKKLRAFSFTPAPPVLNPGLSRGYTAPFSTHSHSPIEVWVSHLLILFWCRQRKIALPDGVETVADLKAHVTVSPSVCSLVDFLKAFYVFTPIVAGCEETIERIGYEFCEDQARSHVLYCEARYAPHLLVGDTLSARQVVEAMNRGIKRGSDEFGVMVRTLLCCMRRRPEWSMEVVQLAQEMRNDGVVGVDLAGDESAPAEPHRPAFDLAKELNIPRTVHAAESGPAEEALIALDHLHAQRIGHGYHIVESEAIFDRVRREKIHLECCYTSSRQTCAVPISAPVHPISHFVHHDMNMSINTDDPSVCDVSLSSEYDLLRADMCFSEATFVRLTFNAARSSFLPPDDKERLLEKLREVYYH